MTRKQLYMYLTMHDEITFKYNGKKYSITFYSDDEHESILSFCEYYKESTDYYTVDDFMEKGNIDGRSVVDILYDIDDADIY